MSGDVGSVFEDRRRLRRREYDGRRHRITRASWVPAVAAGLIDCVLCGGRILAGAPWDLAHAEDRRFYLGPAHEACNRRTAAKGLPLGRRSRQW